MLDMRVSEIPKKHILNRWTRDARDILPDDLVRYQNDNGRPKADTYRHSKLYHAALAFVRQGDANVESYEAAMLLLQQASEKLKPLCQIRDGMGVADKEAAAKAIADENESVVAQWGNCDDVSTMSKAPERKRPAGRPTNSRDKAPYEQAVKRTRFCKICRGEGHKSTTCPERGDMPKTPRKEPKCSNCGVLGHRRNNCGKAHRIV